MEDKKLLKNEELEKVSGGIVFDGQEYDSVQLLDELVAYQNNGDWMGMMKVTKIIFGNLSEFYAEVEKAGREVPETIREFLPH